MQNRLKDLQNTDSSQKKEIDVENSKIINNKEKNENNGKNDDDEEDGVNLNELTNNTVDEAFMKEFFEEVEAIKSGMASIKKNIHSIEESYSQSLVAVGAEANLKGSEELENLIDQTNLTAADVRNKLKEMDKEIKKIASSEKGTAHYRIKTNMHGILTKKFLDLMGEYQEIQTKYKNKYRERVERQYKIVKPDASQEEIDQALESGNTEIFAKEILDTQRQALAKDALAYIENKHKDILRLEQSIQELHQLFLDMAILVESQGELIDQIEYNVSQSVAYTREAVKELRTANQYQKKSRKKMCCLICLFIIVFAILAGIGGGIAGAIK